MPDATPAKNRTIEGWLIRYGKPSRPVTLPNGRKVYEVILADAFAESVDAINAGTATIEANIEHTDDAICRLGLSGKNVKIENRPEGVYATINLISDSISDDIFTRVQAGLVNGLSVEFSPDPPDAEPAYELLNGDYLRKWEKLQLTGFAVTVDPMCGDSRIVAATEGAAPAVEAGVGEASFARSFKSADLAKMQADIERIEAQAAAESRKRWEYEAFLLGIR